MGKILIEISGKLCPKALLSMHIVVVMSTDEVFHPSTSGILSVDGGAWFRPPRASLSLAMV
jgi:hypothetical protein